MSSIKLKVKNKAQFDSRLDKQGKNVRKNMERVVNSITNEVRNIAVRSILQKLGAKNRTEAVVTALRNSLIEI